MEFLKTWFMALIAGILFIAYQGIVAHGLNAEPVFVVIVAYTVLWYQMTCRLDVFLKLLFTDSFFFKHGGMRM